MRPFLHTYATVQKDPARAVFFAGETREDRELKANDVQNLLNWRIDLGTISKIAIRLSINVPILDGTAWEAICDEPLWLGSKFLIVGPLCIDPASEGKFDRIVASSSCHRRFEQQ